MLKILDRFCILIFTALLCVVYVVKTSQMEWVVIRYPYVVIAILAVLLLATFVSEIRQMKSETDEQAKKDSVSVAQFATLSIAMFLYITCIEIVGYFTSSLFFVSFLMYKLGNRDYKRIAFVTIVFVGLQYLFFRELLNLPIPAGFIV